MAKVSSHRVKVECEYEEGKDAESFSLDPNNSSKRTVESDDDFDDDNICSKKPKKDQTQETRFLYSFADNKEDVSDHIYAQPLIRCVWTGTFDVLCDESIFHRRVYSFNAFVSSKASKEVHGMAAKLDPLVHFEMVPSSYIWPRRFGVSDPTDDVIDVYFFPPSIEHERLYDSLALEMSHNDWAMKASLLDSDLLVFSSMELAVPFTTFQDKLYLWGIFVSNEIRDEVPICTDHSCC